MMIKTADGEKSVASKGLAGAALGLAIPGTVALVNQLSNGGGLLGGLFATPGPPMVYHLYRQPLDRMLVRHCLFAMFISCSMLRAIMVAAEGQLNWAVLGWTAVAFPVVTGVTWWNARHPPALPLRLVEWLVCGLLILSGLSLLWSGWRA